MTISYNTNKETGEQEYSGDILVMGKDKEGNPVVDFTIPLLDVRDGGVEEEEYEAKYNTTDKWGAKKIYKKLVSIGIRKLVEQLEKGGNITRGSKFIPKKQQFQF